MVLRDILRLEANTGDLGALISGHNNLLVGSTTASLDETDRPRNDVRPFPAARE